MKHVAAILLVLSCAGASLDFQTNSFAQVITGKTPVSPQTAIVSITPQTLSLRQGGTPAAVTVAGKYLENVLSVQVIRAGQSISSITAKLIAPWPSSGKVEIQAGTGTAVATGYQLRAIVKTGTSQTTIDVPPTVFTLEVVGVQLTAQPGPVGALQTQPQAARMMPDLIVEAIRIDPPQPKTGGEHPGFDVYATIRNQGLKEAFLPRGWCLAMSKCPGAGNENGHPCSDNITIPRGGSIEIQASQFRYAPNLSAGNWTLTVKADPEYQISESDEGNNEKSVPVTIEAVSSPPPGDFIITSLSLDPAEATIAGNFKVVVVVKNQGGTALPLPKGYAFIQEMGGYIDSWSTWNTETMQAGESREFRCTPSRLQVGAFTWTFMLDPMSQVAEADENNNTKTLQVTVK